MLVLSETDSTTNSTGIPFYLLHGLYLNHSYNSKTCIAQSCHVSKNVEIQLKLKTAAAWKRYFRCNKMTFISSNLKKLNESEQLFLWCLGLSLTSVGGSGSMSRHVTNLFSIYTYMYFFIKIGPVGLRMEPLKFTKISFILIKSIDAIESFAIRNRTSLSACNKPIQEVSFFWISRVLSGSQTINI